MAKGSAKLPIKAVQQVRRKIAKPTMNAKVAQEIKVLEEAAAAMKMKTPANWPANIVPNVRAFLPLPDGWYHAKKITNPSGRGSGGKLLPCFVGPEGKVFFHKTDLEKFIGKQIGTACPEERALPDAVRAVLLKQRVSASHSFPLDGVLRRTEKATKTHYIAKRCDGVAGFTVRDALCTFTYADSAGKFFRYGASDLKYDIKSGLLLLETDTKKKKEAAKQRSDQSQTLAGATTTLQAHRTRTSHEKAALMCPKPAALATRSVPLLRSGKQHSPTSSASSNSNSKTSNSSSVLRDIRKTVLEPLKTCAAAGLAGEVAIFTLLGVGHQQSMDAELLSVLPAILRKEPGARGEFGKAALRQFESALAKCAAR